MDGLDLTRPFPILQWAGLNHASFCLDMGWIQQDRLISFVLAMDWITHVIRCFQGLDNVWILVTECMLFCRRMEVSCPV